MHFCPVCGNMYYLKLLNEDQDKLIYYCRNCGNEDKTLSENLNNLYVSKSETITTMNYKNIINKYTKLDPTLPRIYNIDCPNPNCECNQASEEKGEKSDKKDKEILYIRYDDTNMKFVYLCAICDKVWTTETN